MKKQHDADGERDIALSMMTSYVAHEFFVYERWTCQLQLSCHGERKSTDTQRHREHEALEKSSIKPI